MCKLQEIFGLFVFAKLLGIIFVIRHLIVVFFSSQHGQQQQQQQQQQVNRNSQEDKEKEEKEKEAERDEEKNDTEDKEDGMKWVAIN